MNSPRPLPVAKTSDSRPWWWRQGLAGLVCLLFCLTCAALGITSSAQGYVLSCKDEKETFKCWVVLNTTPARATHAVLIGHYEVRGTYSPLFGTTALKYADKSLTVQFEDTKTIDWTKIDPADKCFMVQGTRYTFSLAETKAVESYAGKIALEHNVKIHPRKPDCRVPELEKIAGREITCTRAKLTEGPPDKEK